MLTDPRELAIAAKVAEQISTALMAAIGPTIDLLDEDAPDEVNRPLIVGLVCGVRYFIGQFHGLEPHLIKDMEAAGLPRSNYEGMVGMSDMIGTVVVDMVNKVMEKT